MVEKTKIQFLKIFMAVFRCGKKWFLAAMPCLALTFCSFTIQAEDLRPDYTIMVNRAANCVTVYIRDPATNEFTTPVIAFACSTGMNNATRAGTFATYSDSDYYPWRLMRHNLYAQYAVRFNGHILFHSVPYYQPGPDTLKWEEYNRLGEQASLGCVRLACIDAKWIYDNCKPGTRVIVYDDADNAGPFGKPVTISLAQESLYCGWDPTDPNINNPWAAVRPELQLVANTPGDDILYLPAGSTGETLKSSIGLFTPQGQACLPENCILEVYGHYDLKIPADYQLFVRGFDMDAGLRADKTFTLRVLPADENAPEPDVPEKY